MYVKNIIIIVLMVILSACFSASEISFNTANKKRLKKAESCINRFFLINTKTHSYYGYPQN